MGSEEAKKRGEMRGGKFRRAPFFFHRVSNARQFLAHLLNLTFGGFFLQRLFNESALPLPRQNFGGHDQSQTN